MGGGHWNPDQYGEISRAVASLDDIARPLRGTEAKVFHELTQKWLRLLGRGDRGYYQICAFRGEMAVAKGLALLAHVDPTTLECFDDVRLGRRFLDKIRSARGAGLLALGVVFFTTKDRLLGLMSDWRGTSHQASQV